MMTNPKCPKCATKLYARGCSPDKSTIYYDCSKRHKFGKSHDYDFYKVDKFPEDIIFYGDLHGAESPKIQDTYTSLEDDREELGNLLIKFNALCEEIKVLDEKHGLHLFYDIGQSIRYFSKEAVNVPEILSKADVKLWDIVFKNSGLERLVTATEAAKLKQKYLEKPPIYSANAARELTKNVEDNSGALIGTTLQKIFDTITNVDFYAGNTRMAKKQMKNARKIEKTFRFSWMHALPEYWIEDRHFSFFCDLEMGCAIVSEKPVPVYPNRIMDSMNNNLRRGQQEYQNEYFKLKVFKNGNVIVEFLNQDVVDKLNRWGSKGDVLPPPVSK